MIDLLRNKSIIINSDLDGLISGFLLEKYLNCEIVGFTNSEEKVWFNESCKTPYSEICFIDIFIANPDIITVDQHIISANEKHYTILKENKNKINPNLLNPRFHIPGSSYRNKYPFGTVHFLIALMEKEGFNLKELNLFKQFRGIQLIDLILRADDTMKTTVDSRYVENAAAWWQWLIDLSQNGTITLSFKKHLETLDAKKVSEIKETISKLLKSAPYYCDTSDGGIKTLTLDFYLRENVFNYLKFLSEFLEIELFDLGSKYKVFRGNAHRISLNNRQKEELIKSNSIDDKRLFSYAFVKSDIKSQSFSATFYQNKKG